MNINLAHTICQAWDNTEAKNCLGLHINLLTDIVVSKLFLKSR